jgi:hypothetical protein
VPIVERERDLRRKQTTTNDLLQLIFTVISAVRHYAEHSGYFRGKQDFAEVIRKGGEVTFYDSIENKPVFVAPRVRQKDKGPRPAMPAGVSQPTTPHQSIHIPCVCLTLWERGRHMPLYCLSAAPSNVPVSSLPCIHSFIQSSSSSHHHS